MALGPSEVKLRADERRVRDMYGLSFAFIMIATLGLVAAGSPLMSLTALVAVVLQFGALFVTLRVSGFHHSWGGGAALAAGSVVLLVAIGAPILIDGGRIIGLVAWMLLLVTTAVAVARRLVTYDEVTIPLLMGLLVIYTLIGLLFAGMYQLGDLLLPPGLKPEGQGISGAIYFSFVTLATLGYGDVTPANNVVRALAIAEALVGQLYLVSVVSLAVSRLGRRRARAIEPTESDA